MVPASSDTKEHNPLIVAGPGKELQCKSKEGVSHGFHGLNFGTRMGEEVRILEYFQSWVCGCLFERSRKAGVNFAS